MQPYFDYQDYNRKVYKHQLTKDSNIIGVILLLFTGVMTAFSFIAMLIPAIFSNSAEMSFLEDTTFLMILNGLVSIVAFFGVSVIYGIASKNSIGNLFPVEKIPLNITYLLCTLGLGVCMVANYVSNILIALFDLLGTDALVEMEYECDSVLDIVLFYVSVSVLPALVEEFAFRGVVLNVLRKYSDGLAILVSAVLFGLMHGNFTQIPFALVVGLILGYVAVKTNSLIPGIIIHFLNNAISVTFTLLETNTNLSDAVINSIYIIILLIISALAITSFVILSNNHKGFFKIPSADDTILFKEKVKTVCVSPTIIIFTVFCFMEAVMMLFLEV